RSPALATEPHGHRQESPPAGGGHDQPGGSRPARRDSRRSSEYFLRHHFPAGKPSRQAWRLRSVAGSLVESDPRLANHAAPALVLGLQVGIELLRSHPSVFHAEFLQLLLDLTLI